MKKKILTVLVLILFVAGISSILTAQTMYNVRVTEFSFHNRINDLYIDDISNIKSAQVGHYGYQDSDYVIKINTYDGLNMKLNLSFDFRSSDTKVFYQADLYINGDYMGGDTTATLEVLSYNKIKLFMFDDNASLQMIFVE